MKALKTVSGTALPIGTDNIDTDRIMPSRFLMKPRSAEYHRLLFHDLRFGDHADPAFPMNDQRYAGSSILLVGANFGCGSAREQAVYGLMDYGFSALVGVSFGDIFKSNCINNGLLVAEVSTAQLSELLVATASDPTSPMMLDVERKCIQLPNKIMQFGIEAGHRQQLLDGMDHIDSTLRFEESIEEFCDDYFKRHGWSALPAGIVNHKI